MKSKVRTTSKSVMGDAEVQDQGYRVAVLTRQKYISQINQREFH
jgi:hypothetical protein